MRWNRLLGLLAMVVIIATGCIKIEGEIVINDDGSGTGDWLLAIDADGMIQLFEEFELPPEEVGTPEELCQEFEADAGADEFDLSGEDAPEGVINPTTSPYREDGFCGFQLNFGIEASDDHSELIGEFFDSGTRLFKDGDNWIFEAEIDVSDVTDGTEEAPDEIVGMFFENASYRIVMDLPGEAIPGQNNATSVDGGRFEWDLDLFDPPSRIYAQTSPSGSDPPVDLDQGESAPLTTDEPTDGDDTEGTDVVEEPLSDAPDDTDTTSDDGDTPDSTDDTDTAGDSTAVGDDDNDAPDSTDTDTAGDSTAVGDDDNDAPDTTDDTDTAGDSTTVGGDQPEPTEDVAGADDTAAAEPEPTESAAATTDGDDDGGTNVGLIVLIIAAILILAAGAWWFLTQRNAQA